MQIAICGSGLAGLATAYFLLEGHRAAVTVFDPAGIGGGTSGIAAGLLHPYPGRNGRLSWRGDEGMIATSSLVEAVAPSCVVARGILRLTPTPELEALFRNVGISWTPQEVQQRFPEALAVPGVWIEEGITLSMPRYLEGLWRACEARGARFVRGPMEGSFDRVVCATGPSLAPMLGLTVNKGQLLICRRPPHLPPLAGSLLSDGHITPTEDPDLWQLGSTYEHTLDPHPNRATALTLLEKVALFYPPARNLTPVDIRVGFRAARPRDYRPLVQQIDPRTWAFGGLGSRGLLYHALLGRELAAQIANSL